MKSQSILDRKLDWLDFTAAAMLVYWSNVIFFQEIHSFAGSILNAFAYIITSATIVLGSSRIHYSHLVLIAATIIICLISLLLPAGGKYLYDYLYVFLFAGSMGVLMVSVIRKPQYILFWWILYSLPISIIAIRIFLVQGDSRFYMSTSYYVFNLFVWLLLLTIERTKSHYYIPLVIVTVALVLIGTRGAIVSAVISTFVAVVALSKRSKRKSQIFAYSVSLLPVFAVYYLLFTQDGNNFLSHIGSSLNIQSRILQMIGNKRFEYGSGRTEIYSVIYKAFSEGNLLGYGLAGDAFFLRGGYAHNFILELLVDFGILAIALLFAFFQLIRKSVMRTQNMEWKLVGLLFLFVAFLPKLFSFTLLHPLTLPTIGVLLQIKRIAVLNNIKSMRFNNYFTAK